MSLQNYIQDNWEQSTGKEIKLYNSVTGGEVSSAYSGEIDFESMFKHARQVGSDNLRKMTFHERARMLKALALYLT